MAFVGQLALLWVARIVTFRLKLHAFFVVMLLNTKLLGSWLCQGFDVTMVRQSAESCIGTRQGRFLSVRVLALKTSMPVVPPSGGEPTDTIGLSPLA